MGCTMIVKVNDGGTDKLIKAVNGGADEIVTVAGDYGWNKCSDDSAYCRIAEADQPATDFAWLHTGTPNSYNNKLEKCYFDACSLTNTLANCVVEPTNTPTVCADQLTDFEDWSGAAAIPCKYQEAQTNGSITYNSGSVSINGGTQSTFLCGCFPRPGTGDYSFKAKVTNWSGVPTGTSVGVRVMMDANGSAPAGAAEHGVRILITAGGVYEVSGVGGGTPAALTGATYVLMRVRRVSGTVYEEYNIDGAGWTTVATYSSSTSLVKPLFGCVNRWSADFTDVEYTGP